jgi:hypothetical protein
MPADDVLGRVSEPSSTILGEIDALVTNTINLARRRRR